jgi:hypothetical protein
VVLGAQAVEDQALAGFSIIVFTRFYFLKIQNPFAVDIIFQWEYY